MKILVVSDSHNNIQNIVKVIKVVGLDQIDVLLHCGDLKNDAIRLKNLYPDLNIDYVYGNCDGFSYGSDKQKLISIGGVPIFLTHGDKHNVKSGDYDELLIEAKAYEAEIALCGHTHCAYFRKKEGIILLNPGSISCPRDSHYPSYGIIDINEKAQTVENATIIQIIDNTSFREHPCTKLGYFK